MAQKKLSQCLEYIKVKFWQDSRSDVLAPKPLRGFLKLVARGDRKVSNYYSTIFRYLSESESLNYEDTTFFLISSQNI